VVDSSRGDSVFELSSLLFMVGLNPVDKA
jgi:hypothetical protein